MKKAPKLLFALRAEQWVSIRSVVSGLKCNCHCPACNMPLMAKKGNRQQHHFAHHRGADCPGGLETVLHRFAKASILKAKKVLLPAVKVFPDQQIRAPRWVWVHNVREEVQQKGLQLDLLLERDNFRLAVEIKVTHAVDAYKQQRLIRLGIPSIEIDVGRIYEELLANRQGDDPEALSQAILQHTHYRRWLFNLYQHRWEYRLAKEATPLKVYISKQNAYRHHHVYRCPKKLRFVRGGFRDGQAYARVFQDCMYCQFCREIVYKKTWVGYRQIPGLPEKVICNG